MDGTGGAGRTGKQRTLKSQVRSATHIGELRQISGSRLHPQVGAYLAGQGGTRRAREYQRASHRGGRERELVDWPR